MAAYFLDSSAVAKRYIRETGSSWVRDITDPVSGNRSIVSAITAVEVTAAVVRRTRAGSILPADAAGALNQLRGDLRSLFRVSRIGTSTIESAMQLAERHALRGYDAV